MLVELEKIDRWEEFLRKCFRMASDINNEYFSVHNEYRYDFCNTATELHKFLLVIKERGDNMNEFCSSKEYLKV